MPPAAKKTKKTTAGDVRVRFAPSPTGFFHIGGARTALFNYLFARKNKGVFVLRIEDTDVERSKPEFEKDILEGMKWLGMEWDEGPAYAKASAGKPEYTGNYGPYRESEKREVYHKYIEKLLSEDKAYRCFCTAEDLEAERQEQMSRGVAPKYDGKCSNLSEAEIKKNLSENKKFVIRLRVPEKKIVFKDIIRGNVEFNSALIGDFVIAKSSGDPLFYLANLIDDFEMKITHIIRGEDHIPNTPKQILIQEALGFPQPIYGHIPLILAPDKSKLSKRFGAVAVKEYQKQGYLPEALINFLAFLGWNPGTEKEMFTVQELIKEFSLEKVQKAGAIFDQKKLDFLNGFYIRQKPLDELAEMCVPYLVEKKLIEPLDGAKFKVTDTGETIEADFLEKVISLYQARLKKLSEITDLADFFFKKNLDYKKNLLIWQKMRWSDVLESLKNLQALISAIPEKDWDTKNLQNVLLLEAEKLPNRGWLLWPLRAALSGKESSAGPFEIAEVLGKEKTLQRITQAENKYE